MPKITSEYISYNCIKSIMSKLFFISFGDNSRVDFIEITSNDKKNIKIPIFCREYNGTMSLKQLAFDEMIERTKRHPLPHPIDDTVRKIYKDCFIL